MHDHYWDLYECRWIHYTGPSIEEALTAVPQPRAEADDLSADPAPAG